MIRLIAIFIFCASAFAQGLTLSDVAFISGGNVGAGGGGGGSSAQAPTEYWDFQEASGNRVGEVLGTVFSETGGDSILDTTGLYGNAAAIPDSFAMLALGFDTPENTIFHYETGSDLSVNYWLKWMGTDATGYLTEIDVWSNDFNDLINVVYNPYGFGGPQPTNTFRAAVWHVSATDQVDTPVVAPTSTWQMFTVVYNGTSHLLTFYLNGASVGTTSTPIVFTSTGSLGQVELFKTSGEEAHAIDEFYINTSHALTTDEITWLYNSGTGRQYSDF